MSKVFIYAHGHISCEGEHIKKALQEGGMVPTSSDQTPSIYNRQTSYTQLAESSAAIFVLSSPSRNADVVALPLIGYACAKNIPVYIVTTENLSDDVYFLSHPSVHICKDLRQVCEMHSYATQFTNTFRETDPLLMMQNRGYR